MARPHLCFLQAQALEWAGTPRCKTLSADADDGSATRIVELPAGFDGPLPGCASAGLHAEWLVLAGRARIGGVDYERHGYGFAPRAPSSVQVTAAGAPGSVASGGGGRDSPTAATLLLMTGPAKLHDCEAVSLPATFDRPWQFGADGSVTGKPLGAGIASKTLRRDPVTAEQSFLYCAMPQHPPPSIMVGRFTHPVIEEIFVLDGTYVFGDVGRMGPGGYAFWREGEWHGPAGSETGYHLFIRVIGGPLSNVFSTEPAPFQWHPPYRPALPADMSYAVRREFKPGDSW